MKDLENYILKIFSLLKPETELRWFQIRNELLKYKEVNPNFVITAKNTSFNVRVSRKLQSLVKQGILKDHDRGHKNKSYSLSDKAPIEILKRTQENIKSFTYGLGMFTPDDFLNLSYEQMKAKLLKQWGLFFDSLWRKQYEESRKYVIKQKQKETQV